MLVKCLSFQIFLCVCASHLLVCQFNSCICGRKNVIQNVTFIFIGYDVILFIYINKYVALNMWTVTFV